ncbi:MAG: hypothetical protein HWD86_04800 [Kangiellaceae bacterium]|nr:hypothetical protein [Kangiellaceae bacterium]
MRLTSFIKQVLILSLVLTGLSLKAEQVSPEFNSNVTEFYFKSFAHSSVRNKTAPSLADLEQLFCSDMFAYRLSTSNPQPTSSTCPIYFSGEEFNGTGGNMRIRFLYANPDYNTYSDIDDGSFAKRLTSYYSCPSTHPYHIDTDTNGVIDAPDFCSDQSPCPDTLITGGQALTDSGFETACVAKGSTFCSYTRVEAQNIFYEPYVYYQATGQECSGLGSNVFNDPFGLDGQTDLPEPDQGCTLTSTTQQLCPANPDDKCEVKSQQGGYSVCQSGCGYYNDQFMCTEPLNPDNQDGDSDLPNGTDPNNDSDGDGNPDEVGILKDIDKNTDQLEKIGRDTIKSINALGEKLTNRGATGAIDDLNNSDETTPYTVNQGEGQFDDTFFDADIQAANDLLEQKIAEIKADFESIVTPPATGAGSMPVWVFPLPNGNSYTMDLNAYNDHFYVLGNIIMFICMLIGIVIIIED